jgi:methionine sulfoxide reductase heme-binding subunit
VGSPQWLWFISLGSGLVLLALFTAVVVLGIATRLGWAPPRWPRFVAAELHRSLALFAVALLALHVITAIADPYVTIGWAATVLPFLSPYRTMAVGLGTLAVDLSAAVLLTSLLRHRLGLRGWRAVHWLAYLAWPVAFGHALTAGGDLRTGWVAATIWGSAAAVTVAVAARLTAALATRLATRARRVSGPPSGARRELHGARQ